MLCSRTKTTFYCLVTPLKSEDDDPFNQSGIHWRLHTSHFSVSQDADMMALEGKAASYEER